MERFYPKSDAALGIGGSDISDGARKRHYGRYARISTLIEPHVRAKDVVVDVGCGSGYGTKMLADRFHRVVGVEPNDIARKYAAKHHRNILFADDYDAGDVIVMVEVVEHMTMAECNGYLKKAHTWAVTTPLIKHAWNEYHEKTFKSMAEVHEYAAGWGFKPVDSVIDLGISFTTGEVGDQFLGVYRR